MHKIGAGQLYFDPLNCKLIRDGEHIDLDAITVKLLQYLLSNKGDIVTRKQLMEHVWNSAHVSDDAINRSISVLRKALGGKQQTYITTIPKKGYCFNIVEVSIQSNKKGINDAIKSILTIKKLPAILLFSMCCILLLLSNFPSKELLKPLEVDKNNQKNVHQNNNTLSVAVLPFSDNSINKEQQYYSDGVTEEILSLLSKTPGMKVISRSSSFVLRDLNIDISAVANTLNVDHIVTGSIIRKENRVLISAQVIDGKTKDYLWQESYNIKINNIFPIVEQVSQQIINAIAKSSNTDIPFKHAYQGTANTQAHEEYLSGRFLFETYTQSNLLKARDHYQRAVDLDPNYAQAWVELGITFHYLSETIIGSYPSVQALSLGQKAIFTAREIAPELIEVKAALALNYYRHGETELARPILRRIIKSNPNYSRAYHWLFITLPDDKEAFLTLKSAIKIDPLSVMVNDDFSYLLILRGEFEQAQTVIDRLAVKEPNSWVIQHANAKIMLVQRRYADVVTLFKQQELKREINFYERAVYGSALAAIGLKTKINGLYNTQSSKPWSFFFNGDYSGLVDYINAHKSKENNKIFKPQWPALAALIEGDYKLALNLYQNSEVCNPSTIDVLQCAYQGYAQSMLRYDKEASHSFNNIRQYLNKQSADGFKFVNFYPMAYMETIILIFEGKVNQAMAILLPIIQNGYYPAEIKSPIFKALHAHKSWSLLLHKVEDLQSRERMLLKDLDPQ